LKVDHEVRVALSTKEKEIDALRDSMTRLEKVLIKANERILHLERENEKLTVYCLHFWLLLNQFFNNWFIDFAAQ